MFRFANIEYLWLLAIVPAMLIIYALLRARRRRLMARFGDEALVAELIPDYSAWRIGLRATLTLLAVVFLILAIARPQKGSELHQEHARGVEIVLAVDVSNSMLAEDFEPNRLERTKYAITKLLGELRDEHIGLVVFAGEAKVQYPIANDYHLARAFTRRISPDVVAMQGTDIAQALRQAMLSFSADSERSRVVILITDGENHEGDLGEELELAEQEGVTIYTIGIGTPEGAPIRIGGNYIKDENGEMVVSKLGEETLREIAAATGGAYVRATKQDIGLSDIVRGIDQMERSLLNKTSYERYNELYIYPLVIALVLLLAEAIILPRRNHRIRRFNLFE
ncbi:MAG: VWA domain-containing protein [Rikenellaceae bacterium]|nr:VWA domain-containing protein [Rikenellaceae bacterium]